MTVCSRRAPMFSVRSLTSVGEVGDALDGLVA